MADPFVTCNFWGTLQFCERNANLVKMFDEYHWMELHKVDLQVLVNMAVIKGKPNKFQNNSIQFNSIIFIVHKR